MTQAPDPDPCSILGQFPYKVKVSQRIPKETWSTHIYKHPGQSLACSIY